MLRRINLNEMPEAWQEDYNQHTTFGVGKPDIYELFRENGVEKTTA